MGSQHSAFVRSLYVQSFNRGFISVHGRPECGRDDPWERDSSGRGLGIDVTFYVTFVESVGPSHAGHHGLRPASAVTGLGHGRI